jgi:flagellar biosynthesis/type III secretory pathway M-ring protein FliF/YscJ
MGKPPVQSEPRTPEEMMKYRDLIAAAVGFNMGGDHITVENISFEAKRTLRQRNRHLLKSRGRLLSRAFGI